MTVSSVIIFLVGMIVGFGLYWCKVRLDYEDHGGQILMDTKHKVYRLTLNGEPEEWEEAKWVLLKVTKSEQRLKRLKDIPDEDLNLEEKDYEDQ